MEESKSDLERVQIWKEKFRAIMEEIVELEMQADPSANSQKIREDYLLEKIATIFVSTVDLGRQVRELEKKLNENNKNT